jgi:hypothetical protein
MGYLVYDFLGHRLRRRRRKESAESAMAAKVSYDWKVYAMIALTIVMSIFYARPLDRQINPQDYAPGATDIPTEVRHAYVVAVYLLIVGIWWAVRQARKEQVSERQMVTEQVSELVAAFRSVFRIRPTIFSALEEANKKIEAPTGAAVSHAVTTFYVTSMPKRALDELRERVNNAYMEQFIYVLERAEDAKHEDIMKALDGMLARLRSAREIRDKSEVNMTVITGQSKIIQLIAVLLVFTVGAVPMLREAYESALGQGVFLFFASLGVFTSFYIDNQATMLKERVL